MNFKDELALRTQRAEEIIRQYLPPEEGFAARLAASMNYSMLAGGKRLRPVMMWEAWRMFGGSGKEIEPFMAGMEMIHTHSLIHDDLPAMDDDDLRRGKPTNHKVYGEACAILAGDSLLNRSYEIMLEAMKGFKNIPSSRMAAAASVIAQAAGNEGMIGGQIADIEGESAEPSMERLQFIHRHKTGALIKAAVLAGAELAGAKGGIKKDLEKFGEQLGLAFQICDDILDVTGDEETLGKPVGSDEKNQKLTYPALVGLEESRRLYREAHAKAVAAIQHYGQRSSALLGIAEELYDRVK